MRCRFARGQGSQGTHIVQSVRELDQDHPDIPGHRQKHLVQVVRLGLPQSIKTNSRQLGNPIHQLRHLTPETSANLLLVGGGVLNNIVQDRSNYGRAIHVHVPQHPANLQRMIDKRLPILTLLVTMPFLTEQVGLPEFIPLPGRHVDSNGVRQLRILRRDVQGRAPGLSLPTLRPDALVLQGWVWRPGCRCFHG